MQRHYSKPETPIRIAFQNHDHIFSLNRPYDGNISQPLVNLADGSVEYLNAFLVSIDQIHIRGVLAYLVVKSISTYLVRLID